MRAFSTDLQHRILSQNDTAKSASKEQDLEDDEMKYLIEQKHQEPLKTKVGNRWSVRHAVHPEPGAHPRNEQIGDHLQLPLNGQSRELKTSKPRNPVLQDKHKIRLLRELMPNKAPLIDVPRNGLHATEAVTVKHLATRLAELEEHLSTAKAFDWDAEYRNAQKGQSLQEIIDDAKSLSKSAKKQFIARAKQRFTTAIAEIKANKKKHETTVAELQKSIAALKSYVSHQNMRAVGQGGGWKEVLKAKMEARSEQDKNKIDEVSGKDEEWLRQGQGKNLEELKRKKEVLLRKKDELALKMAQLNAQKQKAISTKKTQPEFDVKGQPAASFKTASTASARKNENQGFSAVTNHLSCETRQSSSLETKSLRLHLPGGILTIDKDLTVDINASAASLRSQISALQDRLSSFYPRLDDLPSSVGHQTDKYILKTWLKILISRWQAKTGNYGTAANDQLKRVMDQTVRDNGLSKEAAERMAKRWNDVFSERRNHTVTAEDIQHVQEKAALDDYDEMGFLQDRYKPEEELAAIQEMPLVRSQPSFLQSHTPQPPLSYREEDEVGLSDEEFRAFIGAFADYGATKSKSNAEKVKMNENLQVKKVGEARQFSLQDMEKQDVDVLNANLRGKELGWGNNADMETKTSKTTNGTAQVSIRTVLTDHSKRSFAHLSTPNLPMRAVASKQPKLLRTHAPSGMAELEAANVASKNFRRNYSTSLRSPLDPSLAPERENKQSSPQPIAQTRQATTETTAHPIPQQLPHLTSSGSAHMVSISAKAHTTRTAIAVGTVYFSNPTPLSLITSNSLKKGDVLSVSRIAGIMAAKKCPEIVPLCHPIPLTHVGVELRTFPPVSPSASGADNMSHGGVQIECKVACTGATGVEMEALTAVMGTALSVVDMCKAVDKFQRIGDVRVVLKEGGKSGVWKEESWTSWQEE